MIYCPQCAHGPMQTVDNITFGCSDCGASYNLPELIDETKEAIRDLEDWANNLRCQLPVLMELTIEKESDES